MRISIILFAGSLFFLLAFRDGSMQQEHKLNWIELIDPSQVEAVFSASHNKPALVFKHSTKCSISAKALSSFEKDWKMSDTECDLYFVDLLAFRSVSNKIAERSNVVHQSPQVIVIYKGEAVYNNSHQSISAKEIRRIIRNLEK